MAEYIKARISSWRTTLLGLGIVALLAYCVTLAPSLLEHPELVIGLAAGLWGVLVKENGGSR